ncbi:uncharacterized protein VTP21DRAFT_1580 [Calcarisporiella thermophila]|uniref:uncharacterized protein n=1 Tax=Calcarisporiella thermophila TaxID=911321 RepID=UPI003742960C
MKRVNVQCLIFTYVLLFIFIASPSFANQQANSMARVPDIDERVILDTNANLIKREDKDKKDDKKDDKNDDKKDNKKEDKNKKQAIALPSSASLNGTSTGTAALPGATGTVVSVSGTSGYTSYPTGSRSISAGLPTGGVNGSISAASSPIRGARVFNLGDFGLISTFAAALWFLF